jgi:hypothetical protein
LVVESCEYLKLNLCHPEQSEGFSIRPRDSSSLRSSE